MYLTAHKLRTAGGQEGVNAFLNLHKGQRLPLLGPGEPDIDYVSKFEGGYPVLTSKEVQPGGNLVIAYLDLVADDNAEEERLRAAVRDIAIRIGQCPLPISQTVAAVAARFGAQPAVEKDLAKLRELFDQLSVAALALLGRRNETPPLPKGPYVVWAHAGIGGIQLWLPPATLMRLSSTPMRHSRILVPHDVLVQAQHATVDVLLDAANALIGLNDATLQEGGGLEVIEPRSGEILARHDETRSQ